MLFFFFCLDFSLLEWKEAHQLDANEVPSEYLSAVLFEHLGIAGHLATECNTATVPNQVLNTGYTLVSCYIK